MNKELLVGMAWAGAIILVSLAAATARSRGYIDEDTVVRVVALNGLMVAYYGNLAPKAVLPDAHGRRLTRLAGWSLTITGLVYAGFWGLAPLPLAMTVGTGALAAGVIATLCYGFWLRQQARHSQR
jgi:hypothetical protein